MKGDTEHKVRTLLAMKRHEILMAQAKSNNPALVVRLGKEAMELERELEFIKRNTSGPHQNY